MPCVDHILKDESCRRRGRSKSPESASTAGKKASSAPYVVVVRLPVFMSAWPYQSSGYVPHKPPDGNLLPTKCFSASVASARYLFIAAMLSFHIRQQSCASTIST